MPIFDFLWGLGRDDPDEVVGKFCDAAKRVPGCKQAVKTVTKCVVKMKRGLLDQNTSSSSSSTEWTDCLSKRKEAVYALFDALFKVDPECRRAIATVLLNLPTCSTLIAHPDARQTIVTNIVSSYSSPHSEMATTCGPLLRMLMQDAAWSGVVVSKENVVRLMWHMSSDAFDAASDAFETVKV
jgi:hypothetical protein